MHCGLQGAVVDRFLHVLVALRRIEEVWEVRTHTSLVISLQLFFFVFAIYKNQIYIAFLVVILYMFVV